jgi:hypothetical protein
MDGDEENTALSSYFFPYGFPLELNGYINGLKTEIDHQMENSSDLRGTLYFLTFLKMYLERVREFYPDDWKLLASNDSLKKIFSVLVEDASTLISNKDSMSKISKDKMFIKLFDSFFKLKADTALKGFLTDHAITIIDRTRLLYQPSNRKLIESFQRINSNPIIILPTDKACK